MATAKKDKKKKNNKKEETDFTGLNNATPLASESAPKAGTTPSDAVKSWYRTGNEGYKSKDQQDVTAALAKERNIWRFMVKPQEEAVIVLVDNVPFFIWEHNLQLNGKWGNMVTCLKEAQVCPVCAKGFKSTFTAYLTCIDTRTFKRKDGTISENRKLLYPAKGDTIKVLQELQKTHGSLAGAAFKVARYGEKSPNCGTHLTFIKKVDLKGDAATPHDYPKVLAPFTEEEMNTLGFTSNVTGSPADIGTQEEATAPVGLKDLIG